MKGYLLQFIETWIILILSEVVHIKWFCFSKSYIQGINFFQKFPRNKIPFTVFIVRSSCLRRNTKETMYSFDIPFADSYDVFTHNRHEYSSNLGSTEYSFIHSRHCRYTTLPLLVLDLVYIILALTALQWWLIFIFFNFLMDFR